MQNEECTTVPPDLPRKITRAGRLEGLSSRFLTSTLAIGSALGVLSCASPLAPHDDYAAEVQFCADEVNRLRATIARPALRRATDLDAFAQTAAQRDASLRVAHYHFQATNGGGVSSAETEILWWRGAASAA